MLPINNLFTRIYAAFNYFKSSYDFLQVNWNSIKSEEDLIEHVVNNYPKNRYITTMIDTSNNSKNISVYLINTLNNNDLEVSSMLTMVKSFIDGFILTNINIAYNPNGSAYEFIALKNNNYITKLIKNDKAVFIRVLNEPEFEKVLK